MPQPTTTVEEVMKAISVFFGDTHRSPEATMEGLMLIREQVETYIDALRQDTDDD